MTSGVFSHQRCFACGRDGSGLKLDFTTDAEGGVTAEWDCLDEYAGYPGIVHGGIIATLLDSAMTNCLMLQGIAAYTAELHVRYRAHLAVGSSSVVAARLTRLRPPLCYLTAEVVQQGRLIATAAAKFMIDRRR